MRLKAPDGSGPSYCIFGALHTLPADGIVDVDAVSADILKSHGFTDPSAPSPPPDVVPAPRRMLLDMLKMLGTVVEDEAIAAHALLEMLHETIRAFAAPAPGRDAAPTIRRGDHGRSERSDHA